ncbi:hypothetical protein [Petrachloros mirabilis]
MTYRSAHHAVICCFVDHGRPGHSGWQDIYDPRHYRKERGEPGMREPDAGVPPSLFRSTLHGMEEIAGEAAIVWKHLLRLNDTRCAALIHTLRPPLNGRTENGEMVAPIPRSRLENSPALKESV